MARNNDTMSIDAKRPPTRAERLRAANLVARIDLANALRERSPRIDIRPQPPVGTVAFQPDGFSADLTFREAIDQSQAAVSFADPYLPGRPLVHVTSGFEALTGYTSEECIGRNCSFLQGRGTDPEQVSIVRGALEREQSVSVELVNYRKDGTPFLNNLRVGPIYDETGRLRYFFGTQTDQSEKRTLREAYDRSELIARESSHRMRNLIQVADAIVGRALREHGAPHLRDTITEKLVAIADAHAASVAMPGRNGIDLVTLAQMTLVPFGAAPGLMSDVADSSTPVAVSGPAVHVLEADVAATALILNELATNSMKHGALRLPEGRVSLTWTTDPSGAAPRAVMTWLESSARLKEEDEASPFATGSGSSGIGGLGSGIVDDLVASLSGKIERERTPDGLKVTFTIPCEIRE